MSEYDIKIQKRIDKDNLIVEAIHHSKTSSNSNRKNKKPTFRQAVLKFINKQEKFNVEQREFNKMVLEVFKRNKLK